MNPGVGKTNAAMRSRARIPGSHFASALYSLAVNWHSHSLRGATFHSTNTPGTSYSTYLFNQRFFRLFLFHLLSLRAVYFPFESLLASHISVAFLVDKCSERYAGLSRIYVPTIKRTRYNVDFPSV